MKDKHIFLIALIFSIIGLLLLLITPIEDFKEITIKEINSLPLESKVKIQGLIDSIYKNKVLTFNLTDQTGTTKVVLFNPKSLNLNNNDKIEVQGIVKTYKNSIEIHAKSIKMI
ncbi:OB-fold nucleic acid binding domain-containing protein [Candidatus Woesearchaeota archaeon]|nr:OB-fold nucleic acid binding domain-containing protein [Candidatus Woesearchaeota archaeon]